MKKFAVAGLLSAAFTGSVMAAPFTDLAPNHWAYKQISALKDAGIIKGYPNNTLKGNENISRYEAAQMVYNALQYVNRMKSGGASVDPQLMDTINALIMELTDEMQIAEVRIEENANAINALRKHVESHHGRGVDVPMGNGRIKLMGQAMFSLVDGGEDSAYSTPGANNAVAPGAGARDGVTEFTADYFDLGIIADIDGKTTFHTRAHIYTGGHASAVAQGTIRFDDYIYFHVNELWNNWDLTFGRQYLPWGHELSGAFTTNPYFVSNSMVDGLYGNMVEGAYFSSSNENSGWNYGIGIHNGTFASPLANLSHLYPHTNQMGLAVAPFDTAGANVFNANSDDGMGFILHLGRSHRDGDFNWDINYFNNGGDYTTGGNGAVATPFAVAGFGEMEFINLGFDFRANEDWLFAGEYVDGSVEATTTLAGRAGTAAAGTAGTYVVEDDFTTWYLQAIYNLNSKSTLGVRYSSHEMDRAGARVAAAGVGGNNGTYDDEADELTFAYTRKVSDNGTLILEYSTADYDYIMGQDKAARTAAGSRTADDFDVIRASYRIDF